MCDQIDGKPNRWVINIWVTLNWINGITIGINQDLSGDYPLIPTGIPIDSCGDPIDPNGDLIDPIVDFH
jgi:hypothetical protein